jgi:ferric-dicitrate binding protein FerR (iron transport regulator)
MQDNRKQLAAEHVQSIAKPRHWKVPAAVVVVAAIAIVGVMRWLDKTGAESAATKALLSSDARTLASARGQRGTTTLSDGSVARIGAESRLRLPEEFGTTMRTLELDGTANFVVAPGKPLPFVVRAANAEITATGTEFAVRAFEDDSAVVVSVTEGAVAVRVRDGGESSILKAGEAVRVTPDGKFTPLSAESRAASMAWLRDTLEFVNVPVRIALPELNRWFDLKTTLADPTLGDRVVSLRIALASRGDALKALADAAQLSIGFDKDEHVVLGAARAR